MDIEELEKLQLHCLDLTYVFDERKIRMSKKLKKKVIYKGEYSEGLENT